MEREKPYFLSRLEAEEPFFQEAVEVAKKLITPEHLYEAARKLATVYGPSRTVLYTVGPVVESIVSELNTDGTMHLVPAFKATTNLAIVVGEAGEGIIYPYLIAHGDEICYSIHRAGTAEAELNPLCAHRQRAGTKFPAVALRYFEDSEGRGHLEVVANGVLETREGSKRNDFKVVFCTERGSEDQLKAKDVVVFNPTPRLKLEENKDTVTGVVDNRVGVASSLLIAKALSLLGTPACIVITDPSEGQFDPPVFGRGARALAEASSWTEKSRARYVVLDGHDVRHGTEIPPVALYSGVVSKGRGSILPPDQDYRLELFAEFIRSKFELEFFSDETFDVETSRTCEQGLREAGVPDWNIVPVGYGVIDPHHVDGNTAQASLKGLVETARVLTLITVAIDRGLL